MKFLVVLACVVLAVNALTDEQKAKLLKHKAECLAESKVDVELVKKLHARDYSSNNEELKEFTLCMLIKSELMTKEGVFRKDVALAKIPEAGDRAPTEVIIDQCLTKRGSTPEENSWLFMKCYHEKNPKHALL